MSTFYRNAVKPLAQTFLFVKPYIPQTPLYHNMDGLSNIQKHKKISKFVEKCLDIVIKCLENNQKVLFVI